jgi:hypothetical protein
MFCKRGMTSLIKDSAEPSSSSLPDDDNDFSFSLQAYEVALVTVYYSAKNPPSGDVI